MTEREYVEHIRKAADFYLREIIGGSSGVNTPGDRVWENAKLMLSPHTAIALCDAWLEKHGGEEAK
jgi:hypothetical protein